MKPLIFCNLCLSAIVTVGCSSETGSGGNTSQAASSSSTQEESPADISTVDLIASETFDFNSQQQVSVQVNLAELASERAYLNICYAQQDGTIDRDNCLVQAPLEQGSFSTQLALGGHQSQMVMEIWSFSDLSTPLSYYWTIADGQSWLIQ